MNDSTGTKTLTGAITRRAASGDARDKTQAPVPPPVAPRRVVLPRRNAFTLAEAVISVAVVGLMLVAALNTLGASAMSRLLTTQQRDALMLADDLMGEILAKPYADPSDPGSLGPETGETRTATRAAFDDADDYEGWKKSPPEAPDGTALKLGSTFTRSTRVQWATYAEGKITTTTAADTGMLVIRVRVDDGDRNLVSLFAFKTADFGWLTDMEEPVR